MLRTLRYFIIIAVLTGAAAWLADQPGSVSMEWAGYQIDTSFGILAIAIGVVMVLSALLYQFWLFIVHAPQAMRLSWRTRKRNKGFQALTKGMVAVAAGDASEAQRQAKRAEGILSDPPLTMLLSAQAAQLNGDERAAERFFKAMTGNPETEFLGLRGLLNQAVARGDNDEALGISRRAHRLKPDSEWVSQSLFELQTRAGQWLDASVTAREATRNKHLTGQDGNRRQAVLSYQLSMVAEKSGDHEEALKHASTALDHDATLLPAVLGVVRAWIEEGKMRKAGRLIEKTWGITPHPDLVDLYKKVRGMKNALTGVKIVERLAGFNPGHNESQLAIAEAALEADLWGQARKHLGIVHGDAPSARVCRMMAKLEEAEHGDIESSHQWLVRATMADPDPAYVCGECGHTVGDWQAVCGNCNSFDCYEWRVPPHAVRLDALNEKTTPEDEKPIDDSLLIEHNENGIDDYNAGNNPKRSQLRSFGDGGTE